MPFLNKVSGGSGRKFGLSRRSVFYTCNTNTAIVTLNNTDRKCYYPASYVAAVNYTCNGATATLSGTTCNRANYAATASQGPLSGWSCPSGGTACGSTCVGKPNSWCSCSGWCDCDCNAGCGPYGGYTDGSGVSYCYGRPDWSYGASPVYSTNYSCPTGGTVSGGTCINVPSYAATANYSCPTHTGIATVSSTNCVYPAAYNATENG